MENLGNLFNKLVGKGRQESVVMVSEPPADEAEPFTPTETIIEAPLTVEVYPEFQADFEAIKASMLRIEAALDKFLNVCTDYLAWKKTHRG